MEHLVNYLGIIFIGIFAYCGLYLLDWDPSTWQLLILSVLVFVQPRVIREPLHRWSCFRNLRRLPKK